ncbi:MAG: insulinase family protein [Bacteroidetes bacterium]|nr:insulinase family protein [Bacteroidota bacterium]
MKRLLHLGVLLGMWLPGLGLPAVCAQSDSTHLYLLRDKLPTNYWYSRLPNGLHLLVIEDSRVPLVTLSVSVPGGLSGQYTGYAGVPSLLAHLLVMHSAAYVDGYNYRRALQEATFYPRTEVQLHGMLVQGNCLQENLPRALKVLYNTLNQPAWDTLYVGKAMEQVKQQIEGEALQPARYQQQALLQILWGRQYRFREQFPEFYKLRTLRTTALADYRMEHFRPEQSLLVLEGNITPQEARLAVEEVWGQWASATNARNYKPVTVPLTQDTLVVQVSEQQETPLVTVAWQLPSVQQDSRLYYAALLLEELLRQRNAFTLPLTRSELAHSLVPSYEPSRIQGSLRISMLVKVARVPQLITLVQEQVAQGAERPLFSQKELDRARQQLEIQLLYTKDAPLQWAGWLAAYWGLHQRIYSPIQLMDSLRAVKPADMQRLFRDYLHQRPMVTAILGNSTHLGQDFLVEYIADGYVRRQKPATTVAATTGSRDSLLAGTVPVRDTLRVSKDTTLAAAAVTAPGEVPPYARVAASKDAIPTREEITAYTIYYDYGKVLPDSSAEDIISRVVLFLNLNPARNIVIRAHTDSPGSLQANLQISERRATLLKQYIVNTYRIMPQRIAIRPMGEAQPVVKEVDETSRRLNRRVEFEVK